MKVSTLIFHNISSIIWIRKLHGRNRTSNHGVIQRTSEEYKEKFQFVVSRVQELEERPRLY